MSDIQIFPQELKDGISEGIKHNSVAYVTELSKAHTYRYHDHKRGITGLYVAKSSFSDEDLHPIESILASTTWNKNDDVFDKIETWAARFTPEDKPVNLGHDEHVIVGHIIHRFAIDANGTLIPDDTPVDQLPDFYHLVTGAVIYKHWTDPEYINRTVALIDDITKGNKFVSMECLFRGFDYAVKDAKGEVYLIPRNETTAFLSKYLRAYGGDGLYKEYKIGRVLRKITFSGKGIVDNPANPDSIIFRQAELKSLASVRLLNQNFEDDGVILNSVLAENGAQTMADTSLETKVNELSTQLAQALADNLALKEKLSKADLEGYTKQIEELKAKVTELTEANSKLVGEVADAAKKKKDSEDKHSEMEKQYKAECEAKAALVKELDDIKAAKVLATRVAALVDKGLEKDAAEATAKKFTSLNDEQFGEIVALANVNKAKEEVVTDTKVIDTAKPVEGAALAAASVTPTDNTKLEKARADIAKWGTTVLGVKNKTQE